ncbi:MAG: YbaK/EbsC family protein [Nocardioidaceae bacterium]
MTDSDLSHPGIDRVTAALRARGWDGTVRTFPDGVRTAAAAAQALGCDVGAIANSLLFDADGSPVLILTSGAHRVEVDLVAATLGVTVLGRSSPDFVRTHTGQAIGGVAPSATLPRSRRTSTAPLPSTPSSGPRPVTRTPSSPRRTPSCGLSPAPTRSTSPERWATPAARLRV